MAILCFVIAGIAAGGVYAALQQGVSKGFAVVIGAVGLIAVAAGVLWMM